MAALALMEPAEAPALEPVEAYRAPRPFETLAVTYHEFRMWAVWLQVFTASDLADAMGVDVAVGERGVKALLWHGIVEDTGDEIDGPFGVPEPIIAYVPLPPGPTHHPHQAPEWASGRNGCGELAPANRGMPVRIRTERDMRRSLSTPGARQHHLNRERAYERQEEARRLAKEKAAANPKLPKWMRRSKKQPKNLNKRRTV